MRRWMKTAAMFAMAVSLCVGNSAGAWAASSDREESDAPVQLDTPDVWWEESKAGWDKIEDAYQYEVRIYRDGYRVDTVRTKGTKLECRGRMDRAGEYTFEVRARAKSGSSLFIHSDWSDRSDSYVVDDAQAEKNKELRQQTELYIPQGASGPGDAVGAERPAENQTDTGRKIGWNQDNVGWWWLDTDGTYPVNQWRYIDNVWYFFDQTGYMKTGWISWNGAWYYCDASGAMLTNTYTPDGYYVDGNGVWRQ